MRPPDEKNWSFKYSRTLSFYSTALSVLEFSHDHSKLISGNGSGDIKVWDAYQWAELRTLQPEGTKNCVPRCVSMSPGGLLACCHENSVCVYTDTGELHLTLEPPQDFGKTTWRCLCFSPTRTVDNRLGESGEDNSLVAWTETSLCVYSVESDSTQPRLTRSVVHATGLPKVCAFSRCGTRVVCGHEDGQIYVWNASSFTLEKTLIGHLGAVTSLEFSLPTKIREIRDGKPGEPTQTVEMRSPSRLKGEPNRPHSSNVGSMLVTCSVDKSIRIWEGHERGWQLAFFLNITFIHDNQYIRSCEFTADGNIFVSCAQELVVWRWQPDWRKLAEGEFPLVPHQKLKGCMDGMRLRVVAAGDNQIVVGSFDGVLGVWTISNEPPPENEIIKSKDKISKQADQTQKLKGSHHDPRKKFVMRRIDSTTKNPETGRAAPRILANRCVMQKVSEVPKCNQSLGGMQSAPAHYNNKKKSLTPVSPHRCREKKMLGSLTPIQSVPTLPATNSPIPRSSTSHDRRGSWWADRHAMINGNGDCNSPNRRSSCEPALESSTRPQTQNVLSRNTSLPPDNRLATSASTLLNQGSLSQCAASRGVHVRRVTLEPVVIST